MRNRELVLDTFIASAKDNPLMQQAIEASLARRRSWLDLIKARKTVNWFAGRELYNMPTTIRTGLPSTTWRKLMTD